jgi:hypothetical protein
MASFSDYKKLFNKWVNKNHKVGSPELDALIRIAGMARTAFGDLAVTQSTPVYKGSAQYGLLNEVIPLSSLGGVATSVGSLFSCQSGTSQGVGVTGFRTLIRDDVDAELLRDGVFTLAVRTTGGNPSDFSGVITYLEDL